MYIKPKILAVVLLLLGHGAWAGDTNSDLNGFYLLSSNGTGPEVPIDNGRTARLGEKVDLKIVGANVHSINNDNTLFRLGVAFVSDVDGGQVVFRLRNRAYRWTDRNSQPGHQMLGVNLPSREEAEVASRFLGVECGLRSKPNYKVSVRFVPAKAEYMMNEPVLVQLELKNLGDANVRFIASVMEFKATRSGEPVTNAIRLREPYDRMIPDPTTDLAPQKLYTYRYDLKNSLDIDKPGIYEVSVSYDVMILAPKTERRPNDPPMQWTDLVTAPELPLWDDLGSPGFKVVISASARK